MLVFTRKLGERIVIGDNIEVAILQIRSNQVRVGVAAPVDISVRRIEVPKPVHEVQPVSDAPLPACQVPSLRSIRLRMQAAQQEK
jgi:carbon storage regulator